MLSDATGRRVRASAKAFHALASEVISPGDALAQCWRGVRNAN